MATNQSVGTRFTWGDSVRVTVDAPKKYKELESGSVCGIREIDTEESAQAVGESLGTVMYIVEASDGRSLEISERYLESY